MTNAAAAVEFSAATQSGPRAVVADLVRGFAMGEVWRAFAWDETLARYRRSFFGLAWIAGSYVIFVAVIAIFFGSFSSADAEDFLMYVALGFAAFVYLNGNIIDGCAVFVNSATWIKSTPMPYSVYVYKSIFRSLTPFGLELLIALIGMLVLGWRPSVAALWAVPAFGAYLVFGVWSQYLLGLVAARFRDVGHLVGAVTRILFFTTPIMWTEADAQPIVRTISDFNPLTHLVEIFRAPLLNATVPVESWIFVGWFTLAGIALTLTVAGVMRARLPFWI